MFTHTPSARKWQLYNTSTPRAADEVFLEDLLRPLSLVEKQFDRWGYEMARLFRERVAKDQFGDKEKVMGQANVDGNGDEKLGGEKRVASGEKRKFESGSMREAKKARVSLLEKGSKSKKLESRTPLMQKPKDISNKNASLPVSDEAENSWVMVNSGDAADTPQAEGGSVERVEEEEMEDVCCTM
jgi:hypothetical protein